MQSKNKIYFIMLGLVAQLFFFGYVAMEPLEASDNLSRIGDLFPRLSRYRQASLVIAER